MKLSFVEFLDLVRVIRMLYGVQIARDFFEFYYKRWGFKFTVENGKLIIPIES